MTPALLLTKANVLEREILEIQKKIDRLKLAQEARKQKHNRLLNLIATDAGADLLLDE